MFDERTSCMKPDLHVSINIDAVEIKGWEVEIWKLEYAFEEGVSCMGCRFYKSYPEVHVVCNFYILRHG